jgi:hypothetical protein
MSEITKPREIARVSQIQTEKQTPFRIFKIYEAVIISAISSGQEFFDSPGNYRAHEQLEKLVRDYVPQLPPELRDYLETRGYLPSIRRAIQLAKGNFSGAINESHSAPDLSEILSDLEEL